MTKKLTEEEKKMAEKLLTRYHDSMKARFSDETELAKIVSKINKMAKSGLNEDEIVRQIKDDLMKTAEEEAPIDRLHNFM
jgi:uncharacterized protein YnzC (UPF0291/DUF896 family)